MHNTQKKKKKQLNKQSLLIMGNGSFKNKVLNIGTKREALEYEKDPCMN